jgi:anti-sigma regulatory factor (Ser/Thr protein kinase)
MAPLVSLEIPPRSPYVGVVRLTVAALARSAGLDETVVEDLRIAVSEACANAVIANEEAGSTEAVVVDWLEEGGRLVVEVGDRGTADHGTAAGVDTDGFSSRLAMSVALLESLVDDFTFAPREGGGSIARLTLST